MKIPAKTVLSLWYAEDRICGVIGLSDQGFRKESDMTSAESCSDRSRRWANIGGEEGQYSRKGPGFSRRRRGGSADLILRHQALIGFATRNDLISASALSSLMITMKLMTWPHRKGR